MKESKKHTEVVAKNTAQQVKGDVRPRMPHVGAVVYGGAAGIPAHLLAIRWHKYVLYEG